MISEKVKAVRKSNSLTQKEFAELFGLKPSTISGWENQNDSIPIYRIIEIANYFKISLDYIFGINENSILRYELEINKIIISKRLKNLRRKNNITQKQLSKKLNTNQSVISHYETGTNIIPTFILIGLIKIYPPFSIDKLFKK